MSHPYVCTTCRLRSLALFQSRVAIQRQWLSQSTWQSQEAGERASVTGRGSHRSQNSQATWPVNDRREYARRLQSGEQPRGRYSGRPLDPRQLLDQLGEPVRTAHTRASTQRSHRSNPSRGIGRTESRKTTELSHRLAAKLEALEGFVKSRDLPKSCEILQELARDRRDVAELKFASRTRRLYNLCRWIVKSSHQQWARELMTSKVGLHELPNEPGHSKPQRGPSPLEVLRVVASLNLINSSIYLEGLGRVEITASEWYAVCDINSTESRDALLKAVEELMGLWNLCMAVKLRQQPSASVTTPGHNDVAGIDITDWSFLPTTKVMADSIERQQASYPGGLSLRSIMNLLVPETPDVGPPVQMHAGLTEHFGLDYASSALATLDLLRDLETESHVSEAMLSYRPWLDLMTAIHANLKDRNIPPSLAQRLLKTEDVRKKAYYEGLVGRLSLRRPLVAAEDQSIKPSGSDAAGQASLGADPSLSIAAIQELAGDVKRVSSHTESHLSVEPSRMEGFVWRWSRRLTNAMESGDSKAAERIWDEMQTTLSKYPTMRPDLEFYDHVLRTFMTVRLANLAVEVWQFIVKAGYQPTGKSYTIMMRGWAAMSDFQGLEGFWHAMRQNGHQPDVYAWTVRINGLFHSSKSSSSGLRALSEMEQEWMTAAKKAYVRNMTASKDRKKALAALRPSDLVARFAEAVDGVPRPNVVVMNAAIAALAMKDDTLIPKVLAWGRSFGLEPDRTTYNALINVSMRHGQVEEAQNFLRRMRERAIEPDGTTWTVLLTAFFQSGTLDDVDNDEREILILDLVDSIDSQQGASIDEKGYALIIDRLLKQYNNPTAAQSMLSHMAARGVQPSTHIYTILMASYFQQSPPNLIAVDSLWTQIKSQRAGRGEAMDNVFYDRMIEGYATNYASVGSTPMLSFLTRMESEGKFPSWTALEAVARTLASANEWQRLTQVVERVRRRMTKAAVGEIYRGGAFGQRNFWEFILSTGLLRDQGFRSADDVMRAHVRG